MKSVKLLSKKIRIVYIFFYLLIDKEWKEQDL